MEKNLFSRDELRDLEKAAKDKDKKKLLQWASALEYQYRMKYEKRYKKKVDKEVNAFLITMTYILHFSEVTHLNNEQISEFADDVNTTFEMYTNKEFSLEDYKQQLRDDGITMKFSRGDE